MSPLAFQSVYSGLPRYAPGSDPSTRKALGLVPGLRDSPCVLDLGCGAGRHTLELARQLKTKIVAVDLNRSYLDELAAAASEAGLADLIEIRRASMDKLKEPAGSIDLIWSEGAAYNIGVAQALELWRPLLREGGVLAFTELTWLADDPPATAVRYWAQAYPDMTSVAGNRLNAEQAGYKMLDTFTLPVEDWQAYYEPLKRRIAGLRAQAIDWSDLAAVIKSVETEIGIFEQFGDSYGYVFYILRPGSLTV
jgi:serine/threonine-protein kinase HipA